MVLLLNGSINAGKTTVAKELCQLLPRTAHIEVDALNDFIEWMPLDESIPINLRAAVAVGKVFLEEGLNIVLSYPLRPEDYRLVVEGFRGYPVHTFTLAPRLEVARSNRGRRELTAWEYERISFHYASGIASPEFGVTIDNSNQTPEETAQRILEQLRTQRT